MQREGVSAGENEDSVWVFNTAKLISHNAHIRGDARRIDAKCAFCQGGVAAVLDETKESSLTRPALVPSDRGDKEGDSPHAFDSGDDDDEARSMRRISALERALFKEEV